MNVFIVRTRLQSLIIEEIISIEKVSPHVLVVCYFDHKNEDAPEVYATYDKIKKEAVFSIDVFASDKLLKNVAKYVSMQMIVSLTKGKVFLAGVDSFSFALAAKLFPFAQINTFDDGSYNVQKNSKYFCETPLARPGFKGLISKLLFPKGGAKYLRARSKRHYTVFADLENIVEKDRVMTLQWDWSKLLDQRDVDELPAQVSTIFLGTAFQDFSERQQTKLRQKAVELMDSTDLYIMHPREKSWLNHEKVTRLSSPAEAVLVYMQRASKEKLTVYHYDTTAAYSLRNYKDIKFIDLLNDD